MTHLQIQVLDAHEAAQAAAAGIDAVELVTGRDPARDLAVAKAVRAAFPGVLRLRLIEPGRHEAAISTAISAEADEIAFAGEDWSQSDLGVGLPGRLCPVAIVSSFDQPEAIDRLSTKVRSIVLAAANGRRLIDTTPIATLDAFASTCRAHDIGFGLAGGLEAPDVARLLLLRPDVIAFDTAVRRHHAIDGALDTSALDAIRALIPWAGSKPAQPATHPKVTDRIFVRDFEVSLAIGAYQAEHGTRQRVRFSVVADVVREPVAPRDMRDVFSYDVIIETIRVLAERSHVTFVETLAEEVADSLLTQADVVAVAVKVEKLDVIAGAVGIEIFRRRES